MKTLFHLALVWNVISVASMAFAAEIDVFFSPHGGTQAAMIKHIDAAQAEIFVAAYSLTADPIANALLRAAKRGVQVHLLVDRRQPTAHHSQVPRLAKAGIPTRVDRVNHLMHQKLLLIDRRFTITGSYNFSANAENRNAEITLFVDDVDLAATVRTNWIKLHAQSTPLNQPAINPIEPPKRQPSRSRTHVPRGPPDAKHVSGRRPVRRVLRFLILRRPFHFLHRHRFRS